MKLPSLSPHAKAQLSRYVRIFVLAFASSLSISGGVTSSTVIAAITAATEVTWRQIKPATPDNKDTQ